MCTAMSSQSDTRILGSASDTDRKPGRSARLGVIMRARRSLSLRSTFAVVVASTITVLTAGFGVVGASAASAATCSTSPSTPGCLYKWKITRVTHARARRGAWHDCVSFAKAPHSAWATCALGRSRSTAVTATLTGNLEVPRRTLSAAVGYQVQQTTSVTASYTATIPAHHSGVIRWSAVFTQRRKVQQRRWTCVWHQVGGIRMPTARARRTTSIGMSVPSGTPTPVSGSGTTTEVAV